MQWWELAIGLGADYDDFVRAEGAYLDLLDQGGDVRTRRVQRLGIVEAVSCDPERLDPLMRRACRWPSAQITLTRRSYPAPPCAETWERLYGGSPR